MKYLVRGTTKEVPLGSTLKIVNDELLASIWVKVDCVPELADEPIDEPTPTPLPAPEIIPLYKHIGALSIPTIIGVSDNPLTGINQGRISFKFNLNELKGTQGLISRDSNGMPAVGEVPHLAIYVTSMGILTARMQTKTNSVEIVVPGIEAGKVYDVMFEFYGDKIILMAYHEGGDLVSSDFEEGLEGFNWQGVTQRPLVIGALNWGTEISNVMNGVISDIIIKDLEA